MDSEQIAASLGDTLPCVGFRPADFQDAEFAYRLHQGAMRHYVEQTYGPWDEAWQREYFGLHFQPGLCRIITCDGQDVGIACTAEREGEVFLSTLEVLPEHQRMGIGTFVLQCVKREATARGKDVTLQVLRVNLEALRLYRRLGFIVVGQTVTHYAMRAPCERGTR